MLITAVQIIAIIGESMNKPNAAITMSRHRLIARNKGAFGLASAGVRRATWSTGEMNGALEMASAMATGSAVSFPNSLDSAMPQEPASAGVGLAHASS
ncbi:hypothetical protein [Terricaulis silvestris]|uniref:hypothetical protein n=1 Tax=Terricaulis silvestris TaxID=2686094 RepID=UPI001E38C8AD|nr:hypothetical protein [Terricaulis silvestris]